MSEDLVIEYVDVDAVELDPDNAREHPDENLSAIRSSLDRFGQVVPIVVHRESNTVVGGNGTLTQLRELEFEDVAVVYFDGPREEAKALAVALNATTDSSHFNEERLSRIVAELHKSDFDLDSLGFDQERLEELVKTTVNVSEHTRVLGDLNGEEIPEAPSDPVTVPGDLWVLGDHLLWCGDSLSDEAQTVLASKGKAALVVTDPPYGVSVGTIKLPWQQPIEEMTDDDLRGDEIRRLYSATAMRSIVLADYQAGFYFWSGPLVAGAHALLGVLDTGLHVQGQVVWVKPSLSLGQADYQWKHEVAWYGFHKNKQHRWKGGRDKTTVWEVARERVPEHPTNKPVELWARPILNHLEPGEVVLDLFAGSGPAFAAAEQTEAVCVGAEIKPAYCDVIIDRWENLTGGKATRA